MKFINFFFDIDDKPFPVLCPNIGIRLHIEDYIPDQHIEVRYRPISKNLISSLSNAPVKLTCPKVPSDIFPQVPVGLDSSGKYFQRKKI